MASRRTCSRGHANPRRGSESCVVCGEHLEPQRADLEILSDDLPTTDPGREVPQPKVSLVAAAKGASPGAKVAAGLGLVLLVLATIFGLKPVTDYRSQAGPKFDCGSAWFTNSQQSLLRLHEDFPYRDVTPPFVDGCGDAGITTNRTLSMVFGCLGLVIVIGGPALFARDRRSRSKRQWSKTPQH